MGKRYKVKTFRVREFCETRGWSPEDLARFGWISFNTARNLYYGKTVDPTVGNAIPTARALGTYVEDLVVPAPDEELPGPPVARPTRPAVRQEGPFASKRLRVKEFCDDRSWGVDELARASGVNFNTVRGVMYGQTVDPTISTLIPIAHALGKHVEELVVEETEEEQRTPLGNVSYAA